MAFYKLDENVENCISRVYSGLVGTVFFINKRFWKCIEQGYCPTVGIRQVQQTCSC